MGGNCRAAHSQVRETSLGGSGRERAVQAFKRQDALLHGVCWVSVLPRETVDCRPAVGMRACGGYHRKVLLQALCHVSADFLASGLMLPWRRPLPRRFILSASIWLGISALLGYHVWLVLTGQVRVVGAVAWWCIMQQAQQLLLGYWSQECITRQPLAFTLAEKAPALVRLHLNRTGKATDSVPCVKCSLPRAQ